jgi:phosphatidylserine decarboxylase
MSEAAQPNARGYANFNEFFTRSLRPGARPLADGEHVVCCPVDGTVSQIGRIHEHSILQAKGRYFSLAQLLGGDESRTLAFRDGDYATLYLSPRDYHRIHMPVRGQLREMVHIPGRLFSVSPASTRVIPGLFARNERVVTLFETDQGPLAMVLVGALNVASIETVWAGPITPPLGTRIRARRYPQSGPGAISLEKGMEMGRFNMGSTVIVLFGRQAIQWNPGVRPDDPVRMGANLGTRCH